MDDLLDCYSCVPSKLIRTYARARYESLARRVIHHLRRLPAMGRFSPWHRTAWDEYCYELQFGPYPDMEADLELVLALADHLNRAIENISDEEAAMLTLAAAWEADIAAQVPEGMISHQDMHRHLEQLIVSIAMWRDLTVFEQYDEYGQVRPGRRPRRRRSGSSPNGVEWSPPGAKMTKIAWTPPGSENGLATVLVDSTEPLTWPTYLGALASRIDGLVRAETPERARELLAVVEDNEPLSMRLPEQAGAILAEYSDRMAAVTPSPSIFPVPVSKLKSNPRMKRVMRDETLEEYLGMLYGH